MVFFTNQTSQFLVLSILVSILTFGHAAANNSDKEFLVNAKQLLDKNQADNAIALLENNMAEFAGLAEYDYLLGRAAIAAKKPNLAVFALERVSLTNPDLHQARFLLGKAYYLLKEMEQANREFDIVMQSNADESLREASKKYIDAINKYKKSLNSAFNLTLTLGIGTDSNANNATENPILQIGNIQYSLSNESVEKESMVSKSILSASYRYKLFPRIHLKSSAQLFDMQYPNATFVNTRGAAGGFGFSHRARNKSVQSALLNYNHIFVDKTFNSQSLTGTLSHFQKFANDFAFTLKANGGRSHYDEAYSTQSSYNASAGGSLFFLPSNKSVSSNFSLLGGIKKPRLARSLAGYKYANAIFGVTFKNGRKAALATNLSYTQKHFDKKSFAVTRNENSVALSSQLNLKPVKNWTFSSQFRFMRTRSPIDLYQYDKVQLMFLVSRTLV